MRVQAHQLAPTARREPLTPTLSSRRGGEGLDLIRADHLEHVFRLDLKVVASPAGADDRTGEPGLVDPAFDHRLLDMDGDDFAARQPGLPLFTIGALQLDDLRQLAFEGYRALGDTRHIDELAWRRGEPRDLEFADVVGDVRRRRVHLLRQIHGGEIPDELAAFLDVLDAVLPRGRGKADDRRMVAKAVEKTVGREVDVALGIARGDPADRTRRDDGVERIVPEAVAVPRFVEVQVFLALGVHCGSSFFRHCEPTGRANARPTTNSAKQSRASRKNWIASSLGSSQ